MLAVVVLALLGVAFAHPPATNHVTTHEIARLVSKLDHSLGALLNAEEEDDDDEDVNVCVCANGTPQPNADCKVNGANECASCNAGYRLANYVPGAACVAHTCPFGFKVNGAHACEYCGDEEASSGMDATGGATACDLCSHDHHVQGGQCVRCPAGTSHRGGDVIANGDTQCSGVCVINHYATGTGTCKACEAGKTRAAGDAVTDSAKTCSTDTFEKILPELQAQADANTAGGIFSFGPKAAVMAHSKLAIVANLLSDTPNLILNNLLVTKDQMCTGFIDFTTYATIANKCAARLDDFSPFTMSQKMTNLIAAATLANQGNVPLMRKHKNQGRAVTVIALQYLYAFATVQSTNTFLRVVPSQEQVATQLIKEATNAPDKDQYSGFKECYEDLVSTSFTADGKTKIGVDVAKKLPLQTFEAYFVPYYPPGTQLDIHRDAVALQFAGWNRYDSIGFVDIPKTPTNADPKFVITGAMNGCSLYVVQLKANPNVLRVFHDSEHLLPAKPDMFANLGAVLCQANLADYETRGVIPPNSFTWMAYNSQAAIWEMKMQKQMFMHAGAAPIGLLQATGEVPVLRCTAVW